MYYKDRALILLTVTSAESVMSTLAPVIARETEHSYRATPPTVWLNVSWLELSGKDTFRSVITTALPLRGTPFCIQLNVFSAVTPVGAEAVQTREIVLYGGMLSVTIVSGCTVTVSGGTGGEDYSV